MESVSNQSAVKTVETALKQKLTACLITSEIDTITIVYKNDVIATITLDNTERSIGYRLLTTGINSDSVAMIRSDVDEALELPN